MTTKELATRWFEEIWNRRNPGVIHEMMDAKAVGRTEGGVVVGPDAFVEHMFTAITTAFPDFTLTVHQVMADGDDAVARWTGAGTHVGPLAGIAGTGKRVEFSGMTWLRFRDGKLVEGADGWNLHGLLTLLSTGAETASVKCVG